MNPENPPGILPPFCPGLAEANLRSVSQGPQPLRGLFVGTQHGVVAVEVRRLGMRTCRGYTCVAIRNIHVLVIVRYVCLYECVYIYIHTYIHSHTYIYIYIICIYIYMYECICIYIYYINIIIIYQNSKKCYIHIDLDYVWRMIPTQSHSVNFHTKCLVQGHSEEQVAGAWPCW